MIKKKLLSAQDNLKIKSLLAIVVNLWYVSVKASEQV